MRPESSGRSYSWMPTVIGRIPVGTCIGPMVAECWASVHGVDPAVKYTPSAMSPPMQQARDSDPMLFQCWSTVYGAGPTLKQHWFTASCWQGSPIAQVLSHKLRYIIGFGLVEMAISTNPKPTIYRNVYENSGHGAQYIPVGLNQPDTAFCSFHFVNSAG